MLAQVAELTELDRVGRARLRARRLLVVLEPVVTERALPHAAIALALVEHAEGTGGNAIPAAIAHVLLHHDGVELRAEECAGRADVQARGLGAVLADVRGHEPAETLFVLDLRGLLDELHVTPRVRAQVDR